MENIKVRKPVPGDLQSLLDIYNYEVENSVATFDLHPKTLDDFRVWYDSHNIGNHPLIVAEIGGQAVGYATLSSYRDKEAYSSTVELSVYISPNHRGKGAANALMREIIDMAKKDERTHTVVSVITSGNEASRHLHEKFGFTYCGTMEEVGKKFGRYLGTDSYTLLV